LSQDSENLVRAALAAWNSRGPAAFVAYTSEDIVLEDPPEQPDRGQWIGRDAVSKRLEEMSATTGGRWVDIEDVRAIGDRLLVLLDWRRGNSPHAPMLASIYLLIEADDSQISSVRVFLEERAAIEAVAGDVGGGDRDE
jgi:ketosteroid isomerase-like protein